jgi:uncharacterized protein YqjF (DUF2071 family)
MIDRLAPTRKPAGARQGFQRWHRLLFSHWEVPASILRPLIDARLTLDDFEGRCFVGLVAFEMRNVKPFDWLPKIPTATNFPELNLRTYVHLDGQEPGVTFFSLDAASALVVTAARLLWGLPYYRADFPVHTDEERAIAWKATRTGEAPASFEAGFTYEEASLPASQPGTLEFFLAERYQFYAARGATLCRARVHHPPYALHRASVSHLQTDLLTRAGLPHTGARTPDLFSPGVDVEIFPLQPVGRARPT